MMMKDLLILLCIHRHKGWMRERTRIGDVLLTAAACDLVMAGRLVITNGKIDVPDTSSIGDPLLDDLLGCFAAMNGKRYLMAFGKLQFRKDKYYRMQIKQLCDKNMIAVRPLEWLGINWGKLYRVNRPDELRKTITLMDRALIYGRKPNAEIRLITEWLKKLNLLSSFYHDTELKSRSKKTVEKNRSVPYPTSNDTLAAIQKQLGVAMNTNLG